MKELILDKLADYQPLLDKDLDIIYFWSISCEYCHILLQRLNAIQNYCSIATVHVPLCEENLVKERIEAFIDSKNITLPVCYDNEHQLFAMTKSGFVPTLLVLGKDELTTIVHLQEIEDKIEQYAL